MLSVRDAPELQAAVLAMAAAGRGLRLEIDMASKRVMSPVWKTLVESRFEGMKPLTAPVLGSGLDIAAGTPLRARAAQGSGTLASRVIPNKHYAGFEFGADTDKPTTYTRRSKNGGRHEVTRRTMRHLPPRRRKGWIVYPAFAEIGPRMVSLWVHIIVKKYLDAAEGKS